MTQPLSGPKAGPGLSNFECSATEGIAAYTYSEDVFHRLDSLGLGDTPERPRLEAAHNGIWSTLRDGQYFDGRLPVVIRKLNLDQLSSLYSLFANWYQYLIFITRKVATERSEALRKKEFLWSFVRKAKKEEYKTLTGKALQDQSASDEARGDVRFIHANAEYDKANCLFEILSAMCEVAEQDMKVISREVTIQQEAYKQKIIGNSFGGRGQDWSEAYGGGSHGYHQRAVQQTPDSVPEDPGGTEAAAPVVGRQRGPATPFARPPAGIRSKP